MPIAERTAVQSPPLEDLDAGVIEEARARQRRHRALVATVVVAAAGGAAILIGSGGGGGSGGTHAARGAARARPHPFASAPATLAACVFHPGAKDIDQGTPSRSLLSILGVLRRSATPADALPGSWFYFFTSGAGAHIQGGDVFVRFVRRARVIGDTTYYLVPSRFTGCGVYKITGEGVSILAANPNGIGSGGRPADASRIEQGRAYLTPSGARAHTTIAMLIPNGVATVTLHYPPGAVGATIPGDAPAFTTTKGVVENLLVVTVPRGANRFITPMTMTWRAADGHVVKTFATL